jgi:hypothetical protein
VNPRDVLRRVRRLDSAGPTVVELLGQDARTKVAVARAAAADLGLVLRVLPSDALPADGPDLESAARLWHRDSRLLPIALFLDAHDADPMDPVARSIGRFLARSGGLVFVGTREPWPGRLQPLIALEVPRPTASEQEQAWTEVLPGVDPGVAAALSGQFSLDLGRIRDVAEEVVGDAELESATLPERVWDACLARTRPRLDALATRIDPKATWDDIVLPPTALGLLHRITDQVRARTTVYERWGFASMTSRGLGISTLFAGASGTGKTMAAEVIANALRLNLYRIDLSAVVSKYIGETEKNLRRLFDAAEEGGALLFFDEADALFGKRSDVKDSHDRYANIEVSYLLQRMEAYRGLAILTTNFRQALAD